MRWTLSYHRTVVQYLISLREAGHTLRYTIFSLQQTAEGIPEAGVTQIEPGIYMWEIHNHHVVYRRFEQEHRLFISSVRPLSTDIETTSLG